MLKDIGWVKGMLTDVCYTTNEPTHTSYQGQYNQGIMPAGIDVIRGRIVDIGEPIPRRRIQWVGHQAVGLGELADGRVIITRPVIPFAMLRGGCALVQAESPVPARTGEQAGGDAKGQSALPHLAPGVIGHPPNLSSVPVGYQDGASQMASVNVASPGCRQAGRGIAHRLRRWQSFRWEG